jgi:prevent-host-death family protein
MDRVAISKFKATCLALLERVRKTGEPILVTRRGMPVAQILPPPSPEPEENSGFGCMRGTIEITGDIVKPLPAEDWEVLR